MNAHSAVGVGTCLRWMTFNMVGMAGATVQLGVLIVLIEWLRVDLRLATALAVEAAILHNFAWHDRWTWRDRPAKAAGGRWARLARFNLVSGALAIVGNVVLTSLYAERFGAHYVMANVCAMATCSLANFLTSDRLVFGRVAARQATVRGRWLPALAVCLWICSPGRVEAAELQRETLDAWDRYILATERRIEVELGSGDRFLAQDFDRDAESLRTAALAGEIPIAGMQTRTSVGADIEVPGGIIHHWRGAIFIPSVTLDALLRRLKAPIRQEDLQDDVLASRSWERGGRAYVSLKLRRRKFVTVYYDTEHIVEYARHGHGRASSRSVATRIAELDDVGSAREREKPPGHDRGFLWRLNSYWRYEASDGGVIVECESVSLSRDVPSAVRWMVGPMIESAARESMERTLRSMRTRVMR